MNKVFGYAKKGGKDWFTSDAYADKEIEAIKDPEGGSEISLPTAIPSPFARMDLVKTAFRNIAKSPDLKAYNKNGTVIASKEDEKLVSDCFDLAEMLFNIDSIKERIKIKIWDRVTELNLLKNGSNKHRRLAETLELYLDQDKESYNFDFLRRIFLVDFNHKIIGGTSPATLFFTTANDLSHAQIKLTTNDILFDDNYTPLYLRDIEFQKYFYRLFKANPVFTQRMNDFYTYLDKNKNILNSINPTYHAEINSITHSDYSKYYLELNTGTSNSEVEVLGIGLKRRNADDVIQFISNNSDFRIASTKYSAEKKPLVLQNDFSKDWLYAKDKWNKFKVPYLEQEGFESRHLPEINVLYPYLTVSDFLEPYLIRLVYPINKEKYFNGNLIAKIGEDSKGYILPLKKQFFEFFNTEDLLSNAHGKPKIEMEQGVANSVKVILKIPVSKQGEYVSFERNYHQSSEQHISLPEESKNKGIIVEHQFGITLFPFIKTNTPDLNSFYRIQLVDRDIVGELKNSEYNLSFYANESHIEVPSRVKIRSNKHIHSASSKYFILNNEFDYIEIKSNFASGIIIPKWQPFQQGNKEFKFAIDFGTTNTHIEYCEISNPTPRPFDISRDEEIQIATLYDNVKTTEDFGGSGAIAIGEMIEEEFVPMRIGCNNSEYKFPQRTVLAESANINILAETDTLADFNIPFIFEKRIFRYNNNFQTNLKWARREQGNYKRIKSYFENLILILRNKVLFNNGNLSKTKIIWFFPTSMKVGRKDDLEQLWNSLIQNYFHPISPPVGIPESLAPFYYYKYKNSIPGGNSTPAVSIDIGGGTTDTVVFLKNKPLLLTSFKFAANTLFGDGFSPIGNIDKGFVKKYLPYYKNILIPPGYKGQLRLVLDSLISNNKSDDINTFLFSLEANSKISDKDLFSYNLLLNNDEDLKIIFLYFYSSIIYHIALLMKTKSIALPNHIFFSGTGSKILGIISSKFDRIEEITKFIFEKVYSKQYGLEGLKIITDLNIPKESTCKGGLMCDPSDLQIEMKTIRTILTCLEDQGIEHITYNEIDNTIKMKIINEVNRFNDLFLSIDSQYSFSDYFKISSRAFTNFKSEFRKHLKEYLDDGIAYNLKLDAELEGDKEIEETLFFLPLIGTINNLSGHLSELTPINN